jgi:putative flippase GtrA
MKRTALLLGRHQASSLVATLVDYATMITLVETFHLAPTIATASGAGSGAVVNFTLGRLWTFRARGEGPFRQALRYALVSLASLGLNTLGVFVATDVVGIHYLIARLGTGLAVSILWNYPLHRHYVFPTNDGATA